MAARMRVCLPFLVLLFFVMPAAALTPGAKLDEVSKFIASTGTKESDNEPQDVQDSVIISLMSTNALLALLIPRRSDRPVQAISCLFPVTRQIVMQSICFFCAVFVDLVVGILPHFIPYAQ